MKAVFHTVYKTLADRTIIGDTGCRVIAKSSIYDIDIKLTAYFFRSSDKSNDFIHVAFV